MSFAIIRVFALWDRSVQTEPAKLVGHFANLDVAEDLKAKHFPRGKIEEHEAIHDPADPDNIRILSQMYSLMTTASDYRRQQALAKLTPEERKLLGVDK